MEKEEGKTEERPGRRTKYLQRDLNTFLSNIQAEAVAKVVVERRQRAAAQREREELLENDLTLVKKCDEELRGLLDMSQNSTTEEMQKAFHRQQQLYESLFQSKMNIIRELQQELKSKNKTHLDILKRNEEEINVMTEQMKEQMQLKAKEYQEELIQKERHHQEEISAILSNDMEEWDQGLKKVLDRGLKASDERELKFEEQLKQLRENPLEVKSHFKSIVAKKREEDKQRHAKCLEQARLDWDEYEKERKKVISRLKAERQSLTATIREKKESSEKKRSEAIHKAIQKYERLKKQWRHFAVADAKRFKDVWEVIDEDTKQLARRALDIDSEMSQHLSGLHRKQPDLGLLELTGPMVPCKPFQEVKQQAFQTKKSRQGIMDVSSQPDIGCLDTTANNKGEAVCLYSIPDWEAHSQSNDTLSNEVDFWMGKKGVKLLGPLVEQGQPIVKLGSLLYTLGLEIEDLPQLTDYLLKYQQQQQQSEQTEDAYSPGAACSSLQLIRPDIVRPALQSFLEQRRIWKISAADFSTLWWVHTRDIVMDVAIWDRRGNIIPDDKVKMWEAAESILRQHIDELRENSALMRKIESLKNQNRKLHLKLNK